MATHKSMKSLSKSSKYQKRSRTTTKSTKSPVKDIEAPMESWDEEECTSLKSMIHAVSIAQQDFRSHILGELEKIKNKLYTETPNLMRNIEQQLLDVKREVQEQSVCVKRQLGELENRVQLVEKRIPEVKFPLERTVILVNVKEESEENLHSVCKQIFTDGVGLEGVNPVRCERMKSNYNKSSVVKVELKSAEEKRTLLKGKYKLRGTELYREIFIRPSQTREERLLRANTKTILAELPKGKEYRLTAHGRIVRNRDDYYNQSEQQNDVIRATNSRSPSRKGNLGMKMIQIVKVKNVEHAGQSQNQQTMQQSDDLMETEEIKSQANLDPTSQYSASNPVLSEETAKDLRILAHSLSEGLNNMFKDMFKSNGDSWETGRRKRKETHELNH